MNMSLKPVVDLKTFRERMNTTYIGIDDAGCGLIAYLYRIFDFTSNLYIAHTDPLILISTGMDEHNMYLIDAMATQDMIREWMEDFCDFENVTLCVSLGGACTSKWLNPFLEAALSLGKTVNVVCFLPFSFEAESITERAKEQYDSLLCDKRIKLLLTFDNNQLIDTIDAEDQMKMALEYSYQFLGIGAKFLERDGNVSGKFRVLVSKAGEQDRPGNRQLVLAHSALGRILIRVSEI